MNRQITHKYKSSLIVHGNPLQNHGRVVVIGASAGGVNALLRMAARLPRDLPAPILLVLHIGKHRSQVAELLSARGAMPAESATSGIRPVPGRIYVAPPDQHLLLEGGLLRLFRGPKEHHARPAIDPLFRSAAIDCGPRAVGVILTGMLDDGSAGLRAIAACGGTTMVQDPAEAKYPSMPNAALAKVAVDHVAGIDALADLLKSVAQPLADVAPMRPPGWLQIEHAISLGKAGMAEMESIATPSRYTCPDCGGALFTLNDERPPRFRCHTGHAYSLRSLALTQEEAADVSLWAGLRALHEKASLLHRLADAMAAEAPGSEVEVVVEAAQVDRFIERMRDLVIDAPGSGGGRVFDE